MKRGHDVQLHLHPHWLDAKYENGKWKFIYARFKLHNLSSERDKKDINTITGCVSISKKLIEDLIRKVKHDYVVNTFRAGGYLIEPFDKIKAAFLENEIKIDNSVCPNLFNDDGVFSYDFRFYPDKQKYNFELVPKEIVKAGSFTEIPITTVKIPVIINILFTFIRILKYRNLESERKGSGVGEFRPNTLLYRKLFSFLKPRMNQLTLDNNFRELFSYLVSRVPEYSTIIVHPKLLKSHSLKILDEYVSTNKIRFISIQDYLA